MLIPFKNRIANKNREKKLLKRCIVKISLILLSIQIICMHRSVNTTSGFIAAL